jgi:hypothetical protein
MQFKKASDGAEQECLALHGIRMRRYCLMEPVQSSKQTAVRNDCTGKVRGLVSTRDVQCQLSKGVGIEAQSAVEITIFDCRFAGMRLTPVHEECLPRGSVIASTKICVVLDAFLYDADDQMLVGMTHETVLNIVRVNHFSPVWRLETIQRDPFCRSGRQLRPPPRAEKP